MTQTTTFVHPFVPSIVEILNSLRGVERGGAISLNRDHVTVVLRAPQIASYK